MNNNIRWSFEHQPPFPGTKLQSVTYFYRSDCNRRWERFGYSFEDADSLVSYLNSRVLP